MPPNSEMNRFELREPIRSFLKWLKEASSADACVLYLISDAMHNEEKKQQFRKRFGEELSLSSGGKLSVDTVDKYKVLTFIGVADGDNKRKKWKFDYSNRPDKYVIVLDEKADAIENEGISGMTARLQKLTYITDDIKIAKHPARGIFIQYDDVAGKKRIHPPCKKLIAIPLLKSSNPTTKLVGEIRLDLYDSTSSFSQEFQKLALNKDWLKSSLYNSINSTLNFLVEVGDQDAKDGCYKKLYKGEHLLNGLINIRSKVKEDSQNKKVFDRLLHLFLVFQRYTYVGHDDIIKRVTYFITDMCERDVDLPASKLTDLLKAFRDHENLILYDIKEYRDHFMHQFHTFVLGYIIINLIGIGKIKGSMNDRLKNTEHYRHITLTDDSIIRIWILTSLFHDICYLLQEYRVGIQDFLEKILEVKIPISLDWDPIFDDEYLNHLQKLTDLFRSPNSSKATNLMELLAKYFQVIKSKQDHGVLSALLLINRVINYLHTIRPLPSDIELQDVEVYLAGLAISIHNPSVFKFLRVGDSYEIPFEGFPMEFLLAYCDTVQEWGRRKGKADSPHVEGPSFGSVKLENNTIITTLGYPYVHPNPHELQEMASTRADSFHAGEPYFKIKYKFSDNSHIVVLF